jgi:hypothetical protein
MVTGDDAIRGREALVNRTSARLDGAQDPGKFRTVLFVIGPVHPAAITNGTSGVRLRGRQTVHHAIPVVSGRSSRAITRPISAWTVACEGVMQNSVAT